MKEAYLIYKVTISEIFELIHSWIIYQRGKVLPLVISVYLLAGQFVSGKCDAPPTAKGAFETKLIV